MKRVILLSLMLSACSEFALVDERNASLDQVATAIAKVEDAKPMNPGRWETRITLGDFNSAAFEAALFSGIWGIDKQSADIASCVLPDTGARPDMAMLAKAGRECSYDRFRMGATTIDAQMTCKPSATKRVYISLNGTYSPDHFQLYLKADAPGKTSTSERIHFSTNINSIRNGECRGHEDIVAAPALVSQAADLADAPSAP